MPTKINKTMACESEKPKSNHQLKFALPYDTCEGFFNWHLFRYNPTVSFIQIILQKYSISQTKVARKGC